MIALHSVLYSLALSVYFQKSAISASNVYTQNTRVDMNKLQTEVYPKSRAKFTSAMGANNAEIIEAVYVQELV